VINECVLQSYSGTIRLFPNTKNLGPARFHNLRAAGAFLVSASWDGQRVGAVEITSERGNAVRMIHPWGKGKVMVERARDQQNMPVRYASGSFGFSTEAGERYSILPER
jgi:hypothetical protein